MPDHPTPVSTKKHSHGFVPVATCGTGITADSSDSYNEVTAEKSAIRFINGCELMPWWMS
jgi:2,3-bisphosphoglycerate-independent phosphoglycerate mutase